MSGSYRAGRMQISVMLVHPGSQKHQRFCFCNCVPDIDPALDVCPNAMRLFVCLGKWHQHPVLGAGGNVKIFAALVAAFIVAILPGAAPASAARMGGPEIKALIITSRVSDLPAVSTGLGDAASLNCWNGQNEFNRTQACWNVILTFTFIQNGTPIGVTGANLVEYMTLNADGTKWTQHDTMTDVGSSGTTEPVDFQLYYTDCKKPCKAVPHFAGVVKDGASGTVDYSDPLAADQIEQTHTHYLLEASALNYLPLNWSDWNSDEFRCDDDLTPQTELPRVFRTGNLRLNHAASCPLRYSSRTSCGVL
jgi:hypothetical protein